MGISNHLIEQAIDIIADIQGIQIDPNALVDDIILIAYVFDDEPQFMTAITQITNAIHQIVESRDIGQSLAGNLSDWVSFHFQSKRIQKHPADLGIVYQDTGTNICIRGFGHRHLPSDEYRRLYGR